VNSDFIKRFLKRITLSKIDGCDNLIVFILFLPFTVICYFLQKLIEKAKERIQKGTFKEFLNEIENNYEE